MVQECYNTEWIQENGLGLVVRSFRQVADAISRMHDPQQLERFRNNLRRFENLAIFEIPDLLDGPIAARFDQTAVAPHAAIH
jgi:hypothetical protein